MVLEDKLKANFNVWAMKLNPKGGEEGYNDDDARKYLFDHKLLGVGWIVDKQVTNTADALNLVNARYKGEIY